VPVVYSRPNRAKGLQFLSCQGPYQSLLRPSQRPLENPPPLRQRPEPLTRVYHHDVTARLSSWFPSFREHTPDDCGIVLRQAAKESLSGRGWRFAEVSGVTFIFPKIPAADFSHDRWTGPERSHPDSSSVDDKRVLNA